MSDTGSSIISALGAGSGINFNQLANDISEATYSFQRETLQSRNEALQTQISAAAQLRGSLTDLSGALGDRIRTGDVSPRGRIGNANVAQVSSATGTSPSGSYSLEVTQLADSQTLVSPSYSSRDDLVGEGTLRIRFGAVSDATFTEDPDQAALEISVGPTETLTDLAARITLESEGALEAYVAQGTDGAQLVIKGRDGEQNGFVIEPTSAGPGPSNTPGDLSYLAWSPASDTGQLRSSAQDALFELDTVPMRSASNRVTDLPEGIELTLTGTNSGNPTQVEFTQNADAITGVMNDLTAALNDIVALLNGAGEGENPLQSDPGARELRRDLSALTNTVVMPNAEPGEPSTLADLGLSLTRDGTFRIDSARLEQTLRDSPEAAASMFTTGAFGVFATIDNLARENTAIGNPGSLGGSITRYENQIERNDARLERIAEQQENLRAQLARTYAAAESQIAASQSTLDFIRQQFNISDDG
ncbi:MAG: flagellar filament capping protein FliD [Erythrobacter sp.]|uniref:flagellar filament capping protein FliD n=1 Tax=Erythrobacter sp. TaxID=1042 RepID=UPI0026394313|nr:flagellar filament capping protein FliD [Erythrobacter sp.]MDJ0979127.1 flagellar filament capping protein FliD [Erythrobacter sp.]